MAETHEDGLTLANDLFVGVQGLVKAIVKALADGHIDSREGIRLGLRGLPLVESMMDLIDGADPVAQTDLLWVLQHGEWSIKE